MERSVVVIVGGVLRCGLVIFGGSYLRISVRSPFGELTLSAVSRNIPAPNAGYSCGVVAAGAYWEARSGRLFATGNRPRSLSFGPHESDCSMPWSLTPPTHVIFPHLSYHCCRSACGRTPV